MPKQYTVLIIGGLAATALICLLAALLCLIGVGRRDAIYLSCLAFSTSVYLLSHRMLRKG